MMFLLLVLIAPLLADICEDKAKGCSKLLEQCNKPALQDFLQTHCPKSCGFCDITEVKKFVKPVDKLIYPAVPPLPAVTECKDTLEICSKYPAKIVCRGGFYKHCPKTCSRCTVPETIPEIVDIPETHAIPKSSTFPKTQDILKTQSIPTLRAIPETLSKFAHAILSAHNEKRTAHFADELTWSNTAEKYAHHWCSKLDTTGRFHHSELQGMYGENLHSLLDLNQRITTDIALAHRAVEAWYKEIYSYDFTTAQYSAGTGHFTQLVWRGTTSVGCSAVRRRGRDVVCCNYATPGNVVGQFAENVLPPFESGWVL